mmetsp:Transcript_83044/g.239919  ORF Transcript_83044/g.239919 Transcript_83044/m.239919 type:complete len:547 (+) Transcript_83044:86-1726(+)
MTPRSRMSASALRAAAAATALAAAALGAQPLVPMQVVVSDKHACALHTVGVVTCWGYGPSLGIGLTSGYVGDAPNEMGEHLAAVDFGPGRYAVELIGAQYDTTIARLSDDTIVAWGSNNCKLPLFGGNVNNVGANRVPLNFGAGRTAISIAIGGSFLCVVLDNHQVKCMGGSGMTPASVPENTVCTPGKTLDDIPPIDVGSHSLPIQVMALGNTVCVLFEDGSVKCFGKADGANNRLRTGSTEDLYPRSAPASAFGDNLTRADLGVGKIERLVGGPGVACAVAEGGLVKCWGHGGWCMTGSDAVYTEMNFHDNDVQVSSSADHVCTLANGDVRCYGANNFCQIGYGTTGTKICLPGSDGNRALESAPVNFGGRKARAIATSYQKSCAMLEDHTLYCWGRGLDGVVGLGNTSMARVPSLVVFGTTDLAATSTVTNTSSTTSATSSTSTVTTSTGTSTTSTTSSTSMTKSSTSTTTSATSSTSTVTTSTVTRTTSTTGSTSTTTTTGSTTSTGTATSSSTTTAPQPRRTCVEISRALAERRKAEKCTP